MAKRSREKIALDIRSPRAAAVAGLIFAILSVFQLALASTLRAESPDIIQRELIENWTQITALVVGIMPFTGIAFIWFTAVIRDWLGEQEDRFFSTVFFGSGIIYVAMMFVYGAVLGAIIGSFALTEILALNSDVFIFGYALINEVLSNYALRMAGVYMLSIGSLLFRTGQAPRWLVFLTFIVAVSFLLFAGTNRVARYIFPGWVAVLSIYILIVNYRRQGDSSEEV